MNYILIENGQITKGPMNLPKSWKNMSSFHKASDSFLLGYGWYPVDYIEIVYDNTTQYRDGYLVDIQPELVVLTSKIVDFTRYQLEVNLENDWFGAIEKTDDLMTRKEEDHITDYHSALPSANDKVAYNNKIAERAKKPAIPVLPKPGEADYVE